MIYLRIPCEIIYVLCVYDILEREQMQTFPILHFQGKAACVIKEKSFFKVPCFPY